MSTKISKDNANEYRLTANEIMRLLYEAGQREQLELLRSYADTAIKMIDKDKR